jgi:hypothetical protein
MAIIITDPLPENADKYWQRPDMKERGDVSPEPIYLAVGSALAQWESIENSFVSLFCHFIEPRVSNAAARAYGAISSSQGRIEALENAAIVYFHLHNVAEDLQNEFQLIIRHFNAARGRRNDIAHAVTINFQFEAGVDAGGVFLIPAMYGSRKTYPFIPKDGDRFSIIKSKYRFTSEDIVLITNKFYHLIQVIFRFHSKFCAAHPFFEPPMPPIL